MNKLRGESCLQEETKTRNNVEKWESQLVFRKTINVARGGQKRSRPKPISRPARLVYVVDVAGFSLCQERTYSNVYGY